MRVVLDWGAEVEKDKTAADIASRRQGTVKMQAVAQGRREGMQS